MSRFREFLYLDDSTVHRLLFDTFEATSEGVRGLDVPRGAEQEFHQLWKEIFESDQETILSSNEADAAATWQATSEGQFVEFTGRLTVPSIVALVSAADELRNFLQLGQQLGFIPISGDEDEQLAKMAALRDLIRDTFPVVLRTEGSDLPIVLPLDTSKSRVKVDRYTGRATVFGRVIERTDAGEKKEVIQIPGTTHIAHMSRQQRRAAARQGQDKEPNDITLDGPVLTLRVLAIQQ